MSAVSTSLPLSSPREFLDATENIPPTEHGARFDWKLFLARSVYWLWTFLTKITLSVVYLSLIRNGLTYVFPDMGMKLSKLPGLAFLSGYTAFYRLELAHVFAAFPLLATWVLWAAILEIHLLPDRFAQRFRRWDVERAQRVLVTLGVIVIVGDACCFYSAFTLVSWGGMRFSATALVATLLYIAILVFLSLGSLYLGDRVTALKESQS